MEWLATYKARLDYYHKTLECVSEEERRITLQGIQKAYLGETNITPSNEKVLQKGMSTICDTGVGIN
jgi:hypothetical protein